MYTNDIYSIFNSEAIECKPWCGCGDPVCDDALFYVQDYFSPEKYLPRRGSSFICINCDMSHERHWS